MEYRVSRRHKLNNATILIRIMGVDAAFRFILIFVFISKYLCCLSYADDAVFNANSLGDLKYLMSRMNEVLCRMF